MPQYIKEDLQGVVNQYFRFVKSGLFSKNNNQEGAIPVILTLLTLNRVLHDGSLFYSTSTNLEGKIKCEADLSVLNIKYNKIEFGIGECKSKGQKINAQDISNFQHVQDEMNKLGIECYMIFSKAGDSFCEDELELFTKLDKEGRKFVLLTNKELEPYQPYWELDETEKLPKKYALSLEDMYLNSKFIYLSNKK